MYYLEDLVGEVVTAKLTNGLEVIAELLAIDEDHRLLTVANPRVVVFNSEGGELAIVPFLFTALTDMTFLSYDHVYTVVKTGEDSKNDYVRIVGDQATPANNEVDSEAQEG